MHRRMRLGIWAACAGVALQVAGLGLDAALHQRDPDLAAREGAFSLANPVHLAVVLGLGLTVFGVAWALLGAERVSLGVGRRPLAPVAGSGALVVLLALTGGVALATGGISGHGHGHDDGHGLDVMALAKANPTLKSLIDIVRTDGTEAALARLEELAAVDPGIRSEAHDLTHAIGIYSFTHYRGAQQAFSHCRETFQSGCYHGVLEAYLQSKPNVKPQDIASLCAGIGGEGGTSFLKFQCVHGLGHGLTLNFKHDIMPALRHCDYLPSDWDQRGCYGGVFMENIIFAWHLWFGKSTSGQEAHTHPGDHKIFLNAADPFYPCNAIESRYQLDCHLMQTSAILMFNGYDFARAFRTCESAPNGFVAVCHQSMGRDVSAHTTQDVDASLQLCAAAGVAHQADCFVGVVKHFIDVTWTTERAFAFCGKAPAHGKQPCYRAIGEQVAGLFVDQPSKSAECAKAEAAYVGACAAGALIQ